MFKKFLSHKKLPYQVLFLISFSFLMFNFNNILSTDFHFWLNHSFKFADLLKNGELLPDYYLPYPAVPVLYLSSFFILLKSLISNIPFDNLSSFVFAYKFPFILLISLFITYLFFLLNKNRIPYLISFIACFLLAINPFIWQSNAADILLAIFGSLSIISILIYLNLGEREKKYLFLSAVFSSLAILSRTSGIFLVAVVPLIIVFYKRNDWGYRKIILRIFFWLIILILGILLLWPNLWLKTQKVIKGIIVPHRWAIDLRTNYLAASKLDFTYKIKETFFHLPIFHLYFLLMFFTFVKKNLYFFKNGRRYFRKDLFVFISVMILFYLSSFFIKRGFWCFRYFSLSWVFLDIIIAYELLRQSNYFLKLASKKSALFYLIFLLLLYAHSYWYFH